MRLSRAVEEFVAETRMSKSPATASAYESDLRRLVALASPDSVLSFTPDLVTAYFLGLSHQNRKMSTLHRKAAALREFARWGIRKKLWWEDPLDDPKFRFRKPDAVPRPFAPDEIERLMALELPRVEHVCRGLLYYTGLRVTPICQICLGHLSFAPVQITPELMLPGSIRAVVKGTRTAVIPMHPDLKAVLFDYTLGTSDLKGQSRLLQQANGRPFNRKLVEKMTRRWGERANVPDCVPHRFRHTFGTDLLRKGVDIRIIQALLTHADIKSTLVYTKVFDAQLVEAILKRGT